MTKQVQIHVATLVNASKIRRETRNGRDVIIVPSATLPASRRLRMSGALLNGSESERPSASSRPRTGRRRIFHLEIIHERSESH